MIIFWGVVSSVCVIVVLSMILPIKLRESYIKQRNIDLRRNQ